MRDSDGSDLGKLDYLRGPHGQHDRETIWRGGLGRIAGTGEGGLMVDFEPKKAHTVTAGSDKKQTAQASLNAQAALTSTADRAAEPATPNITRKTSTAQTLF